MFRWLFIFYFALIHATGLLSAVLASEEVDFVSSGELLCYTQSQGQRAETVVFHQHSPGEFHSHGNSQSADAAHHHAESPSSDIPYIHCDVSAYSPTEYLSIPFEVPRAQLTSGKVGPQSGLFVGETKLCSRNEPPSTLPPQKSSLVKGIVRPRN